MSEAEPLADGMRVFAIDCEMGVSHAHTPVLLHVSMVDDRGNVLLDTHVKPTVDLADVKTRIHGIALCDVLDSPGHAEVAGEVEHILRASSPCVLVGHNIQEDLNVLGVARMPGLVFVRDTATFPFYQKQGAKDSVFNQRKLSHLVAEIGGVTIQKDRHNAVEDAAAAMVLYLAVRDTWEQELKRRGSMEPSCHTFLHPSGIWHCTLCVAFLPHILSRSGHTPTHARRSAANAAWIELLQRYNSTVLPAAQCKCKQIVRERFHTILS